VNHDVTYKVVAHGLGCIGDTATSVVTVLPYPDLSNNPKNKSICSNTATAITLTSSIPGTQFTWTTTPSSANVTGYSNNPVNTVSLNQTLVNTGFATENVIYHLTPHHNSCDGLQTDFTVYVYPVTNILFVPPSQAICSGQQCTINLNSNVAGTTFSWTAFGSSPGITGYSANSGSLIQQPLQNSIYVPGTVTYVVTSSANGCTGRTDSVIVTVKPVPAVSLISCNDTITTTTAQPFKLKGGNPPGGIFSGAGVNSLTGFFSPSLAGTGNHPVTYTYTNTYACSDLAVLTLHVQTPANFICGNSLTDIRDNWAYPTISIGSQCWMAANLNFGSRIISTQVQRDNCQVEKYCFGDINANCVLYGGLYQWDEMMQYQDVPGIQGFCPPGWHVPSEAEWNILFSNYVNNGFAAAALKSSGYSGFNASLFGTEYFNRSSNFFNFATMIWSSTSHGPVKAWAHGMNDPDPSASYYPGSRANAFQVRCLKD
jgi:uncharacterized protein (TIGR02145 family)